jgi:hypothetical protein
MMAELRFLHNRLGTRDNPRRAGQTASVIARWYDSNGQLVTSDNQEGNWAFALGAFPMTPKPGIASYYSPGPSLTIPDPCTGSGEFELGYTSEMFIPGEGTHKRAGILKGYVEATRIVAWVHVKADPCRWQLLSGPNTGQIVGDGREPTSWLAGFGPSEPPSGPPSPSPEMDIPAKDRFQLLTNGEHSAQVDLWWGGLVRQLTWAGQEILHNPERGGPGGSIQVDLRELKFEGSPPGSKKFFTTLMPTQGGNQFSLRPFPEGHWAEGPGEDRAPIYEWDRGLTWLTCVTGLRYYWVDYRKYDTLSDWRVRWRVELQGPHVSCEWTQYLLPGAKSRRVHELSFHVFLHPRFLTQTAETGASIRVGDVYYWCDWDTYEARVIPEKAYQLISDHKLQEHWIHAGEEFSGRGILSPDLPAAFSIFGISAGTPQPRNQPILSLSDSNVFQVTLSQFEAARDAGRLGEGYQGQFPIATYPGTAEQFEAEFPETSPPPVIHPPDPPDPGEPWPDKVTVSMYGKIKEYTP